MSNFCWHNPFRRVLEQTCFLVNCFQQVLEQTLFLVLRWLELITPLPITTGPAPVPELTSSRFYVWVCTVGVGNDD